MVEGARAAAALFSEISLAYYKSEKRFVCRSLYFSSFLLSIDCLKHRIGDSVLGPGELPLRNCPCLFSRASNFSLVVRS
jgi:hypothetical protein